MTYGTSHHALLDIAGLTPGDVLLVLGAGGGIGSASVDVGKAVGAHVIGVVGSEHKADTVRSFGVDDVIMSEGNIRDQVMSLTGGYGADVICDPVGGEASLDALTTLSSGGTFSLLASHPGPYIVFLPIACY